MPCLAWRAPPVLTVLLACMGVCALAQAQDAAPLPEPPPALDLREQVVHLPVTVADLRNREQTLEIPVTVFRPAGTGPYPLVIVNHGRAVADRRATMAMW